MASYVHPLSASGAKGYQVAAMKAAMEILGMTTSGVRPPPLDGTATNVAERKVVLEPYTDVVAGAAH